MVLELVQFHLYFSAASKAVFGMLGFGEFTTLSAAYILSQIFETVTIRPAKVVQIETESGVLVIPSSFWGQCVP